MWLKYAGQHCIHDGKIWASVNGGAAHRFIDNSDFTVVQPKQNIEIWYDMDKSSYGCYNDGSTLYVNMLADGQPVMKSVELFVTKSHDQYFLFLGNNNQGKYSVNGYPTAEKRHFKGQITN